MNVYEGTFGTTPCLITVQGSRARTYVIVDEGRSLRVVGDADGLYASDSNAALARAKDYLVRRFGDEGTPPHWPRTVLGRTILDDPLT